jgi:hypothetical protein
MRSNIHRVIVGGEIAGDAYHALEQQFGPGLLPPGAEILCADRLPHCHRHQNPRSSTGNG